MPELPEVETFKHYFSRTVLNRKVITIRVPEESILQDTSIQKISLNLVGHRFTETFRHGKYLFAKNDKGIFLVMHFGMTGRLEFKTGGNEPLYSRFVLEFSHGCLYYISIRKLGKISTTDDKDAYIKKKRLGPDALDISGEEFLQLAANRKGMVKTILMNQSFIAGLGNIYADEVCYQCGISPQKSLNNIDRKKLKEIYKCIRSVLDTSINSKTDFAKMPDGWLLKRRNDKATCLRCGGNIKRTELGGRGAYFCPNCQK